TKLLAVIQETSHPLLLLIDEYDNFANDIMMTDEAAYKGLVHADGPFKQLMKWVKMATEGQGLKRLFITGVTPVVLSDLTSGMNIAKNVSLEPELNALAGFTEPEIEVLLEQIVTARRESGKSIEISVDEALVMLRTWYNGYRFAPEAENLVYNPTLTLYYLDHLLRRGTYPEQMLDDNLAADENKLGYISRVTAGRRVVVDLLRTGKPLEVKRVKGRFTLAQMLQQAEEDTTNLASFLFYFGMLTLVGKTPHRRLLLAPPNLVVRKLYLDKILELLLPAGEDPAAARRLGWEVAAKGELEPLLTFVEERLFPSFGRRDYLHMNELTVKTTFMALLFDDVNYVMLSEPTVLTPSVE
ncbi:MAG: AAA family ATPase, partial [bacterium]|nr:AAA family ATPase [bacterium]